MKKLSILGALFVSLGATSAWATNACPTVQTALSTYIATGFSCEIGDKVFSNFTYTDSSQNATPIGAGAVEVETLGPTTGTDPAELSNAMIGLQFNAGWSVTSSCVANVCTGAELDSDIGFTVTVINGANMAITDAAVAQTASGAAGQGAVASVAEGVCAGTGCTPGTWNVFTFINSGGSQTAQDTTISPSGTVTVSKDISVTAGAFAGSTATLTQVDDTFSQTATGVPEPGTMALAGFALCGLAAIRRRRAA